MHGTANVRMKFISTSSYAFVAWKGITTFTTYFGGGGLEEKEPWNSLTLSSMYFPLMLHIINMQDEHCASIFI